MKVHLPPMVPKVLREAIQWAAIKPDVEQCGVFMRSEPGTFASWLPMDNVAIDPRNSFAVNSHKVWEVCNEGNYQLAGLFHSHPGGGVEPSETDLHMAKQLHESNWNTAESQLMLHWLYTFLPNGGGALTKYDHDGVLASYTGTFIEL